MTLAATFIENFEDNQCPSTFAERFDQQFENLWNHNFDQDSQEVQELWAQIKKRVGKKMRVKLVKKISQVLVENKPEMHNDPAILNILCTIAVAIELLHTASLIHDDIIDHAEYRRKERAFHKSFGTSTAILTGDVLYSKALLILAKLNRPEIIEAAARATLGMSQSEILQKKNIKNWNLHVADYWYIISHKTAQLMGESCRMVALVLKPEEQNEFYQFGLNLGLSFQLVDDLLDYQGKSEDLGKSQGQDLANGIITYPILSVRDDLKAEEEILLKEYFSSNIKNKPQEIQENFDPNQLKKKGLFEDVYLLLEKLKAFDNTQKEAEKLFAKALANLAGYRNSSHYEEILTFAQSFFQRKH